tara:strand:- start:164 stop:403 length:240 start_codon:yes stop_codon:yes gene_type:complete
MSSVIFIQVFYFAQLREERGSSQEECRVGQGMSVSEIFRHIFGRDPQGIRFAINQSYVEATDIPLDGDEVAFLPPLGGG